jgi:hypothetical protein
MRNKNKTNIDNVVEFMKKSPINQMFIIESLNRYSKQCIDNQNSMISGMENSMINGYSWIGAAKEWKNVFDTY